ncbi:MAG TPA: phosphate ABC transporter substrate-binding protein PstS [Solirubrobacteraceae bacterium]|nr:phosphate ABC transporter substrate-binding protein PstS [Solirubrobacteraceae bacterium]
MTLRHLGAIGAAGMGAVVLAACGSSSSAGTTADNASAGVASGTINGAGSTFAAPIYQQWGATLKSQGLTLNYNPVGSGAGQTELEGATVDFAGSDPALKAADKARLKGAVLQLPVALGAITVSYNVSGLKTGLRLNGSTLARIFMGQVKTWNDPEIKALNPGVSLPGTAITVVHRSDSSGTTAGFTKFLSAASPAWKSAVGDGKDVKWPTGTGAKGNAGVAAVVKQTDGAIGYVEQAYAIENGFTYAAVKNSAGAYELPSLNNTSAAAGGIAIPADLGISTIDAPAPGAYPIVSQTFIDVYKDPCRDGGASSSTAKALKSFLAYAVGAGQRTLGAGANQIPYAALPTTLVQRDQAQLATMTCNGSPVS